MDGPKQPVRIPSNRGLPMVIGRFPSKKGGRMVWSEGSLERDYLRLLEFDPEVLGYQEQPILVKYWYWPDGVVHLIEESGNVDLRPGGKRTVYHPDFLVERQGKPPLLVEVKNERFLTDPVVKRKLAAGQLFAESRGWEMRVVTEEIRQGPLLTNLRILGRYGQVPVPDTVNLTAVGMLLRSGRPLTIRALAGLMAPVIRESPGACEAMVYGLVRQSVLGLDLQSEMIGGNSIVTHLGGGTILGAGTATAGRTLLVQR